jgi:hypothetical protein
MKYPSDRWSCTTGQGSNPWLRSHHTDAHSFVGLGFSTNRQRRFPKSTRFWPPVETESNRRTMHRRTPNCSHCEKPVVAVAIGGCPLVRQSCTPRWSLVRCVGPPRTPFASRIWCTEHVTCDSEPLSSSWQLAPPTAQLSSSTLHRPWPPQHGPTHSIPSRLSRRAWAPMKAVNCCEPFFSNVVVVPKNLLHHEQRLRKLVHWGHCRSARYEKSTHLLKRPSCAFARFYEHVGI